MIGWQLSATLKSSPKQVAASPRKRHPEILWNKVAGIGNVLRHDYDQIALGILLQVATDHLPGLERVCREELVREQDGEQGSRGEG